MLAWLVDTIAAGQLADARGPRTPMALGLLAFAAGLLLAASAGGMAQFLAGRVLQGGGGGASFAAAYVAIARDYPDALRPRMMALTASVWILPAMVGPLASGAIAERMSWRVVFAGAVPLLGVAAWLVLPPLRPFAVRRPASDRSRFRPRCSWRSGSAWSWGRRACARWVCCGRCSRAESDSCSCSRRCAARRRPAPARRGPPMGMVARGLLAFSFFGTEAFVPLGAGDLRGATPTQAGLALSAGALGWIAASWTQDRIEVRRRRARTDSPHGRGGVLVSRARDRAGGADAPLSSQPFCWFRSAGRSPVLASALPTVRALCCALRRPLPPGRER